MAGASFSWDRVAAGGGFVAAALLWLAAATARDSEAFAIGVIVAVAAFALALAQRRWLIIAARVILGVLFVDIGGWMAPAVVSNSAAGESLGDLLMPLALTTVAVAGLIGCVAAVMFRGASHAAVGSVVGVIFLLAVVALIIASAGRGDQAIAASGDLIVSTRNVEFSSERLTASAGRVGVTVKNHDLFWHTFTVDELDLDIQVPTGGTRRAEFDARPGTYEFVCAIPGHETRMRGLLTVR